MDLDVEILINRDNLLDSDYVPDRLFVLDDNKDNFHRYRDPSLKPMIREDIVFDLFDMLKDARMCGFSIIVDSGYRSYNYQLEILKRKIEEIGEERAYRLVALPGASEHQSGLCFDIAYMYDGLYSDDVKEEDIEVRWLMNNSYKYGFVLRYPKGKEDITGFAFEPWHYRYVGVEHAKEINRLGLCLEEYIDYLEG